MKRVAESTSNKAEHLQCPNCGGAVLYAPIERRGRGYWRVGQRDICSRCDTACMTAVARDRNGTECIGAVYAERLHLVQDPQDDLQS